MDYNSFRDQAINLSKYPLYSHHWKWHDVKYSVYSIFKLLILIIN